MLVYPLPTFDRYGHQIPISPYSLQQPASSSTPSHTMISFPPNTPVQPPSTNAPAPLALAANTRNPQQPTFHCQTIMVLHLG